MLGAREQVRVLTQQGRGRSASRTHHASLYSKYAILKNLHIRRNHVISEYVMIYSIQHMPYILSAHKGFLNKPQK